MKDWTNWVTVIGTFVGAGIVGIALASAGEPQMAWLWCEVVGLEVCR